MILYRGQPTRAAVQAARARMTPGRLAAIDARRNEPMMRVVGRWFTDDLDLARWYIVGHHDDAEIVAVEVPDDVAETFRVSNAPVTPCGLEPGRFSRDPEREFVLPMWLVMRAEVQFKQTGLRLAA